MKTIEVRLTVEVPAEADDEQITGWLEFSFGAGTITLDSPLFGHDVESSDVDWS